MFVTTHFFHCKSQKENQYFSSDFPSTSAECQHTHDPARAVLYSGAGNRIGEVLLDRIKRARPLKKKRVGGEVLLLVDDSLM